MSYTQLSYHIVLRTHRSGRTLVEAHERDLYNYMFGFNRNHEVVTYRIGGMSDHVHLLVGLPPTLAVSKYVQELKIATSKWLKENPDFPAFEGWTREYAAFTVSSEARESVTRWRQRGRRYCCFFFCGISIFYVFLYSYVKEGNIYK